MSERTEEQKLMQSPLMVKLGGKEYEVKPLVIRDSRIWRGKVARIWASLPSLLSAKSDKPEDFMAAMDTLLVTMPDTVVDLFFEYAKDIDRQAIEAIASDTEIAKGFEQVTAIAFPLLGSLLKTMGSQLR